MIENPTNLRDVAGSAAGRAGTIWTLAGSEDLNANLVRFAAGRRVGGHVNGEVDVLLLGVSGMGTATVDGKEHALSAGTVLLVPKGSRREIQSASEEFAYLSVHRRRGPLRVGRKRQDA